MSLSLDPLPPNWEVRKTEDGKLYYVDHGTKSTTWIRPSLKTFIVELSSKRERDQWNAIVHELQEARHFLFGPLSRGGMSSSGLWEAGVDEKRVHPEVALVTRSDISLEQLSKMDYTKLNKILVGFVPFSVISKNEFEHKLILPMGLQKLPGGAGSFGHWDTENVDISRMRLKKNLPGSVTNVLGRLAQKIVEKYPKVIMLTRFAAVNRKPEDAWTNFGLKLWEQQFPPGHFRLGWVEYYREEETEKNDDSILETIEELKKEKKILGRKLSLLGHQSTEAQELQSQVAQLKKQIKDLVTLHDESVIFVKEIKKLPVENFGPLEKQPTTYRHHSGGGAHIVNDTLIVTNQNKEVIFKIDAISSINPIKKLLAAGFLEHSLGALFCGWT